MSYLLDQPPDSQVSSAASLLVLHCITLFPYISTLTKCNSVSAVHNIGENSLVYYNMSNKRLNVNIYQNHNSKSKYVILRAKHKRTLVIALLSYSALEIILVLSLAA